MRFLFLFICSTALASVLPSNNSQDLAGSSSDHFHLQGSGPLNGQLLAPLTSSLAHLSDSQRQVGSPSIGPSAHTNPPLIGIRCQGFHQESPRH